MLLHDDGTVAAFGWNDSGQLGFRDKGNHRTPRKIPNLTDARGIVCNNGSSLILHKDGTVTACGTSNGDGTHPSSFFVGEMRKIPGLVDVQMMSCDNSAEFCEFVHSDGTISVLGKNNEYQLGLGDTQYRNVPVKIPGLTDVKAVFKMECNPASVVLHRDGTISIFGISPRLDLDWHNLKGLGRGYCAPKKVPGITNVRTICTSDCQVILVHNDNAVSHFGGYGRKRRKGSFPGLGNTHILHEKGKKKRKRVRKNAKKATSKRCQSRVDVVKQTAKKRRTGR